MRTLTFFPSAKRRAGPAAGHLACRATAECRIVPRDGPSARTRGLRPASPALTLPLNPMGCERGDEAPPAEDDERRSRAERLFDRAKPATERPARARFGLLATWPERVSQGGAQAPS